jgi:hypothetical protein
MIDLDKASMAEIRDYVKQYSADNFHPSDSYDVSHIPIYCISESSYIMDKVNYGVFTDTLLNLPDAIMDRNYGEDGIMGKYHTKTLWIHEDAPDSIWRAMAQLIHDMEGYPCLDDLIYSERQDEALQKLWASLDKQEKLDALSMADLLQDKEKIPEYLESAPREMVDVLEIY